VLGTGRYLAKVFVGAAMTPANADNDVEELIKTLNPAELAEAVRRLKAKSAAYLRSAELIEAWGEANGSRAN
jgi:hypothetical protein